MINRVMYRNNRNFVVCISTDLGQYEGTRPELNVRKLGDHVELCDMWLDEKVTALFAVVDGYGIGHGNTSKLHPITFEQEAELIAISESNRQAKLAKANAEDIAKLRNIIDAAERQKDIPTRVEANRRIKEYNDLYNEGGYGYVPTIVSREEYDAAKQLLFRLESGHKLSVEDC